ncbi:sugar-binding protein [Thalassotalea litorea]|uniref:Sugar-binding protein n=1 Tax=Thalassotalea litorea TaxID=2020715 RepID=A0A5R9IP52_9GAMM|nr:sugar-binding protein [Thalassotalea litorea]TLU66369.1 sugar-binding protein [Thalassotalea litorea]
MSQVNKNSKSWLKTFCLGTSCLAFGALLATHSGFALASEPSDSVEEPERATLTVPRVNSNIIIDGNSSDIAWQQGNWQLLNHVWVGEKPSREDFSGRYKLLWQTDGLYLLVEIVDDILFDQHPNPLDRYWDDDALEIFIDEDSSGGDHTHNFNAFAYHVSLDNQSADMGPRIKEDENNFLLLNHHVQSVWQRQLDEPNKMIWEAKILVFDDSYDYKNPDKNQPKTLTIGKKMGFMLAYCDNDGSKHREHFIGSHPIEPVDGDMNQGFKNASVFAEITLLKGDHD